MRIVYLSNFFNHHQKPLADELFEVTNHQFWFVETEAMPDSFKKTGYTEYKEPYVIKYYGESKYRIVQLIIEADVVICGDAPLALIRKRVRKGKLFFRNSERRYKSLLRYIKWPVYTYQSLLYNNGYLLAASAFASRDYALSGMKPDKCFKWGYFTELKTYDNVDSLLERKHHNNDASPKVLVMWAGRLIGWKHPELVVKLAERLKEEEYLFEIKIAGRGPLEDYLHRMIEEKGVEDCVSLIGPRKQECVRTLMEESDIFLATSDQNEGWGATINESMNSACAVVASHTIGAVPFLIKDGENGLIYKSKDLDSLYTKVKWLIDNPRERKRLGINAYLTIKDTWNAKVACANFVKLIESIKQGEGTPINEGPCSKAEVLNHNYFFSSGYKQ